MPFTQGQLLRCPSCWVTCNAQLSSADEREAFGMAGLSGVGKYVDPCGSRVLIFFPSLFLMFDVLVRSFHFFLGILRIYPAFTRATHPLELSRSQVDHGHPIAYPIISKSRSAVNTSAGCNMIWTLFGTPSHQMLEGHPVPLGGRWNSRRFSGLQREALSHLGESANSSRWPEMRHGPPGARGIPLGVCHGGKHQELDG